MSHPGRGEGIARAATSAGVIPAAVGAGLLPRRCLSVRLVPPARSGDRLELAERGPSGCAVSGRGRLPGARLLICGVGLDVNTAGAADLELLPGIGPVRAQAIVRDRERAGSYRRASDLSRVPGIGRHTASRLASWLRFGEPRDQP